jgi:hypothetical protein
MNKRKITSPKNADAPLSRQVDDPDLALSEYDGDTNIPPEVALCMWNLLKNPLQGMATSSKLNPVCQGLLNAAITAVDNGAGTWVWYQGHWNIVLPINWEQWKADGCPKSKRNKTNLHLKRYHKKGDDCVIAHIDLGNPNIFEGGTPKGIYVHVTKDMKQGQDCVSLDPCGSGGGSGSVSGSGNCSGDNFPCPSGSGSATGSFGGESESGSGSGSGSAG